MDVELGSVDPAPADNEFVHAGVADHHPGHVARCPVTLEVLLRAAETAGVLVEVEQQHQGAVQLVGYRGQPDGEVAKDRDGDLGVRAAAAPQPPVVDDPRGGRMDPGVLVTEGRGVQAGIQYPARAGCTPRTSAVRPTAAPVASRTTSTGRLCSRIHWKSRLMMGS